ncbi:conserved hypothetical protein [Streptomyces scabiei 87.22]|uniref:Uncharacterized protein n=1 Tax=Streptomyces scabiei (strain 87.22) TaxID=680198 RepID=C9Z8M3_STRSW|nr:conserved hypothetical protein [Streptomyces scabiei 87.22]
MTPRYAPPELLPPPERRHRFPAATLPPEPARPRPPQVRHMSLPYAPRARLPPRSHLARTARPHRPALSAATRHRAGPRFVPSGRSRW